jgi:hypothetical protein
MKILLILILSVFACAAQITNLLHDPALDTIANNIGVLDSDINGYFGSNTNSGSSYTNGVTMMQNLLYGSAFLSGSSNLDIGLAGGARVTFNSPTNTANNVSNSASAYARTLTTTVSNSLIGPYAAGISDSNFLNGVADGGGGGWSIAMGMPDGSARYFDLTYNDMPQNVKDGGQLVSNFILAIMAFIYFKLSIDYLQTQVLQSLQQDQLAGLNQEVGGFNAVFPTATVYAVYISAVFAALIGYFASGGGYLFNSYNSGILAKSQLNTIAATTPGFDVLTSYFPALRLFFMHLNYVAFRYFYSWPLFLTLRASIKFLLK